MKPVAGITLTGCPFLIWGTTMLYVWDPPSDRSYLSVERRLIRKGETVDLDEKDAASVPVPGLRPVTQDDGMTSPKPPKAAK